MKENLQSFKQKINEDKKHIRPAIKNIKKKSLQYIKTNVLFFTFVLTSIISTTLARSFTIKNYFEISPILADLAFILLIGAIGYFLNRKINLNTFLHGRL